MFKCEIKFFALFNQVTYASPNMITTKIDSYTLKKKEIETTELKRAFGSKNFERDFFSRILTDLKTNFTKFELSTTFRS